MKVAENRRSENPFSSALDFLPALRLTASSSFFPCGFLPGWFFL
jgi:hypothetical protein